MGGTYWYYYILDGNFEAFDQSQATTNVCPLLPGQTVNVLEVPLEQIEEPIRRASVSATTAISDVHTLRPTDRFQNPRPDSNPKYSRLLTSPSKLEKVLNRAEAEISALPNVFHVDSTLATSDPKEQPAATKNPSDRAIQASCDPAFSRPSEFAGFDFNNFQLEAHNVDVRSYTFEERPESMPFSAPITQLKRDNLSGSFLAIGAGHVRHYSCPSTLFNSGSVIHSSLGSSPLTGAPRRRHSDSSFSCKKLLRQNRSRDLIYSIEHPTANTEIHLPIDARPKTPIHPGKDNLAAGRSYSPSMKSTSVGERPDSTLLEEDYDLPSSLYQESPELARDQWAFSRYKGVTGPRSASRNSKDHGSTFHPIPKCLNDEANDSELVNSPTCGSLTEDVSDESFVASSASSDVWSPQAYKPLRLPSPSLDFALDRPDSSGTNGIYAAPDRDTTMVFHGYSLPDEAGQSQLTITKTITPKTTPRLRSDSQDGPFSKQDFPESTPSLPTLPKMDSLFDDLGYLGGAIS
ncbi:MAG: hypothetical protein Q9165_005609 [Trypethelium subeluteriae]